MTKVLFMRGLPDNNQVTAGVFQGKIAFSGFGGANVMQATRHFREKMRVFEAFFLGDGPDVMPDCQVQPDVIFNEISDPDTHGIALDRAERFCRRFQSPIINPPALIRPLTRDNFWQQLHSVQGVDKDKLTIPKTVRCQLTAPEQVSAIAQQEGITFPLLVRVAGEHGGNTLVRLESPTDFAPLHALPMDGRDFYLTQFVDFRSPDGLYRKYRIVVVAGRPIIRHLITADQWLVNATQRTFMDQSQQRLDEEAEVVETFDEKLAPAIRPLTDRLYQLAGLDYFGIDASITEDGRMLVFEVNANMNILNVTQSNPTRESAVRNISHAVEDLIRSKSLANQG